MDVPLLSAWLARSSMEIRALGDPSRGQEQCWETWLMLKWCLRSTSSLQSPDKQQWPTYLAAPNKTAGMFRCPMHTWKKRMTWSGCFKEAFLVLPALLPAELLSPGHTGEVGRWLDWVVGVTLNLSWTDRYFHNPAGAGRRWVIASVTPFGAREEICLQWGCVLMD